MHREDVNQPNWLDYVVLALIAVALANVGLAAVLVWHIASLILNSYPLAILVVLLYGFRALHPCRHRHHHLPAPP